MVHLKVWKMFKETAVFKILRTLYTYLIPQKDMSYRYKLARIRENIIFSAKKIALGDHYHLSTEAIAMRNRGDQKISLDDSRVRQQFSILDRYFDFITQHILNENRAVSVLDVGCREGYLLEKLHNYGVESVTGFEVVPEWVLYCHQAGRTYVEEKNLLDINPKNHPHYDLVISRHTLEHVDRTSVFFDNLKQLTASNGIMLVVFPLNKSPNFKHPSKLPSLEYIRETFDFSGLDLLHFGRLDELRYKGEAVDLTDARETDEIMILAKRH